LLIIAVGAGQMFAKWHMRIADAARLKRGKERVKLTWCELRLLGFDFV
jgi:hypothetical protein